MSQYKYIFYKLAILSKMFEIIMKCYKKIFWKMSNDIKTLHLSEDILVIIQEFKANYPSTIDMSID